MRIFQQDEMRIERGPEWFANKVVDDNAGTDKDGGGGG